MRVAVAGRSDVGQVRSDNQDSYAWWIPEDPAERERRGILLVVADGMGGARGGEQASNLAVSTLVASYGQAKTADAARALRDAAAEANQAVYQEAVAHPEWSGMGTTCTAAVILGRDLLLAHVGDSRAYLLRDGTCNPLTLDHSLVAQLVQLGQITPEEARVHPRRNIITRAIGPSQEVEVDVQRHAGLLRPGDLLLLCSDGLHGTLDTDEIMVTVDKLEPEDAARALVDAANRKGGPDNITVVLAQLDADTASTGSEQTLRP